MNCCDYDCNQGRNCPARQTPADRKTGWPAPPLAQDDSHPLFRWFASKLGARRQVRLALKQETNCP